MKSLVNKYQVVFYFILATFIIPLVTLLSASLIGAPKGSIVRLVGSIIMKYSPTLAAIFIVSYLAGPVSLKQLLKRFLIWKVGIKWYLIVILLPLLLDDVIPVLIYITSNEGIELKFNYTLSSFYLFLPVIARYFFRGGGMGEEFGWRGYLTPYFQDRYGVLKSAIFVGILWAAWHFPNYWLGSKDTFELIFSHVEKVFRAVPMAIVYAWVFNNTKGSVLLAALMHACVNAFGNFYSLQFPSEQTGFLTNQRIIDWITIATWLSFALFLVFKPGALVNKLKQ